LIRQLEKTRDSLLDKQSNKMLMIECVKGSKTPLSMELLPDDEDDNEFIKVESRKSK
jgi:hypothetical protein